MCKKNSVCACMHCKRGGKKYKVIVTTNGRATAKKWKGEDHGAARGVAVVRSLLKESRRNYSQPTRNSVHSRVLVRHEDPLPFFNE